MKRIDMIPGTKFNMLTLIKETEPMVTPGGQRQRMALWVCDCGNEKEIRYTRVKDGYSVSCGCYAKQTSRQLMLKLRTETKGKFDWKKGNVPFNYRDGDNSRLNKSENYYITRLWQGIKQRCYNTNEPSYRWYGARGIIMYGPWIKDYTSFKEWILTNLGHRPEGYSIDRIDVDGNYEPGNLRWADKQTQIINRRCTKQNKCQI